jgi:ADP-ribosylglycohydrolase
MSELQAGGHGTTTARVNNSKGCGGVMRTAPIGLVSRWDAPTAFRVGAEAAAITHGHPSGYLSGGAMAAIVRLAAKRCGAAKGARPRGSPAPTA